MVMAGGGWITRRVVRDLPDAHRNAYAQFFHSPMLVVNVALKHWQFLYKLGLTAFRWFEGFGFCCNLRHPMWVGNHRPPLESQATGRAYVLCSVLLPGPTLPEARLNGPRRTPFDAVQEL